MKLRLAAGTGLIAAGGILLGLGLAVVPAQHAPEPTPAQAGRTAAPASRDPASPAPAVRGTVLPRSLPVSIAIPAIGVHSVLMVVGRNRDGTIQVPPLDDPPLTNEAAWYEFSPIPGQPGSSIIEGHVDSARDGPSVFFRLGALRPGDLVKVTLADRRVAVFKVTGVRLYPKARFPGAVVYGGNGYPSLRLITCGGAFDARARHYLSNVVAFASLVSSS